jgi:two-component system, LytTR family, response regulator
MSSVIESLPNLDPTTASAIESWETPQPISGATFFPRRLVLKSKGRFIFVNTAEIDWIEAHRNYVCVHVGAEAYLHRQTLAAFEERLKPETFRRIHRSVIVNIHKVKELRPWPTGEYVVLLKTGKELTLSRGYRNQLPGLLKDVL